MGTVLIMIVAILASTSNSDLRADLRKKRDIELGNWRVLGEEWKTIEDIDSYPDTKVSIRNRLRDYKELPQLRIEKLKKLRDDRYQEQLHEFLSKFRIDEAEIKGIGDSRTGVLTSLGITTAADVKANRILGITGFGNAHTDKLVNWRQELEKTFKVDPGRLIVTAEDKQSVDIEILKLKSRYEREIQDGTKLLRTRVTRVAGSYDTLRKKNNDVSMALAQAERNLRAIDTRLTSAVVSITVCIGLFFSGSIVEAMRYRNAYTGDTGYATAPPTPATPRSTTVRDPRFDDPDPGLPDSRSYIDIKSMSSTARETAARELKAEGMALAKAKKYQPAEMKFREAIRHWSFGAEIYYELGNVLNKLDRPDDAARAFENGVGQDASYRDIKEVLGFTYISSEDWDGAKYIFEGLVSTDPKNFKFHYNLALAYRHLGETSPAIAAFERAGQLKPSDAKCHYELGHILVEERRFIEAERELKRLIPLDDRLAKALRTDIDSAKFNY